MKLTEMFFKTFREDPANAEINSHKLLVRAGYIKQVSNGIFTYLPLGLKVLENIKKIIREEMNSIEGQEYSNEQIYILGRRERSFGDLQLGRQN